MLEIINERCFLIQQRYIQKKLKVEKKQEVLKEITLSEKRLVEKPGDTKIIQTIKTLQAQLSMLVLQEREQNLKYMKQRYFEFANKPGRLLT